MSRSLGLRSASFALRSRAFALAGHVVFFISGCHVPSRLNGTHSVPYMHIALVDFA